MRALKFVGSYAAGLATLVLAACQEPQLAPELKQTSSSEFMLTVLADNLDMPWSVAELPDQSFLITEIGGTLLRIFPDGDRREITGLPDDIFVTGQGGLLDVVLAPDFETSNELYISYAAGTAEANGTALIRTRLQDGALSNTTTIFRASPAKAAASHFGGKIAFLPDDTLVLTLGDGFSYREDAQKADTHLGKLVRLTRDGGVPSDNPFTGQEKDGRAFKSQIYSMGHRNVQGLAVDRETGALWEHEHGPRGGDELNRIIGGENYGWPLATTGRDYQGARISPYESFEGTLDPVHDWVPSIAPSGLIIYRGDLFPDWSGDAIVGGLASRDLRRVDIENNQVIGEEDLLSDLGLRIRDVRLARDGAILILSENSVSSETGQLFRLTPKL